MEKLLKTFVLILAIFVLTCDGSRKSNNATASKKENFIIKNYDERPVKRGLYAEHYPTSNERRIDFFMKYIEGIGGCYIGVGTDQNLSFIAKAKSEYAWLMDFDPVIVRVNKIHILFLQLAPDYSEFKKLWLRKNKKESFELVKKQFEKDSDYEIIKQAWETAHQNYSGVTERLNEIEYMNKNFGLITFSNNPEEYNFVRTMAIEGRLQALNGDLMGTKSMLSIASAATSMNCPVRVLYMSNAEEYFRYPENFRKNLQAIPTDSKGLVIRTMTSGTKNTFGFPDGEKYPDTYPFHYNLQPLENLKLWMGFRAYISSVAMLQKRTTLEKGFSILTATPQESGFTETGDIVTKPPGMW
jgi:hypothetical protein